VHQPGSQVASNRATRQRLSQLTRLFAARLFVRTTLISLGVWFLIGSGHADTPIECKIELLREKAHSEKLQRTFQSWPVEVEQLPTRLTSLRRCLKKQFRWTVRPDDPRDIGFRQATGESALAHLSDLAMMLRHGGAAELAVTIQRHVVMRQSSEPAAVQLYSHSRLALLQLENEQHEQALVTVQGAEVFLADSDVHAQAEYYDVAGLIRLAIGQREAALESHQKAIRLLQFAGPSPQLAESTSNAGNAHYYLDRMEPARDLNREAALMRVDLYEENHPAHAESRHNLATVFGALGEHQTAINLQQSALNTRRSAYGNRHPLVAASLNNLALLLSQQGKQDDALRNIELACRLVLDLFTEDSLRAATCYHNLAYHLKRLGRYAEALEKQQRALDIRTRHLPSPHPRIANSLDNLGQLYYALGDSSKQLDYLLQAYHQRQQLYQDGHTDLANSLNNVGFAHAVRGDLELAREFIESGLRMREAIPDHPGVHQEIAIGKSNLGHVQLLLGNSTVARQLNTEAMLLLQGTDGDTSERNLFAQIYNNLAEIARVEEQYEECEELLLKALALLDGHGDTLTRIKIISNMAHTQYQLQNLDLAILYQKKAVNQVLRQRIDLSERQTSLYLQSHNDLFRRLTKWLVEADRLEEANHVLDTMDMFQHQQLTRASQQAGDISLSEDEQEMDTGLQHLLARITRSIGSLLADDSESVDAEFLRKHAKIGGGEKKSPLNDKIPDCSVIPSAQNNEKLTVSARYAVYDDELLIIMEAGEHRQSCVRPISRVRLSALVADFRESVMLGRSEHYEDDLSLNQYLYQLLFRPLVQFIGDQIPERVIVNPDAAISFLPFAALHDGNMFVGARFPLIRRTGTFDNRQNGIRKPRIAGFGLSTQHEVSHESGALPWVRVELDEVIDTGLPDLGIMPGEMYLDEKFVPQRYYDTLRRRSFNILHLTGHFVFRHGSLRTSYFQTGDGRYLYADRVIRGKPERKDALDGVDILMLPSCETALGSSDIARLGSERLPKERHFEGESLATEAMVSGAKTVIASLWKVNDASTANFVGRFYAYLEHGETIPHALMYTRRDFIERQLRCVDAVERVRRQYQHDPFLQQNIKTSGCAYAWNRPYYWAGLALFGS